MSNETENMKPSAPLKEYPYAEAVAEAKNYFKGDELADRMGKQIRPEGFDGENL